MVYINHHYHTEQSSSSTATTKSLVERVVRVSGNGHVDHRGAGEDVVERREALVAVDDLGPDGAVEAGGNDSSPVVSDGRESDVGAAVEVREECAGGRRGRCRGLRVGVLDREVGGAEAGAADGDIERAADSDVDTWRDGKRVERHDIEREIGWRAGEDEASCEQG